MSDNKTNRLISVQTLYWYHKTFGGDQNADESLAFIRSCGFDAIDYHFEGLYSYGQITSGMKNPVYDLPTPELLEYYSPLKKAMETHGVAISQAHGISPFYVPDNDDINEYLYAVVAKIFEVCRFLECPFIVQHPPRNLTRSQIIEVSKPLIPAAIETGVKICFENMFADDGSGNLLPYFNADEACHIIDTLNDIAGAKVFGFCYDIGHANITGRNLHDDVCTYADRLMCLHIHENDGLHDQHMIPYTQRRPGTNTGYTDWEGLIDGLIKIGYNGPINCEVHPALNIAPPELLKDVLKLTAAVCRYFRDRIDRKIEH